MFQLPDMGAALAVSGKVLYVCIVPERGIEIIDKNRQPICAATANIYPFYKTIYYYFMRLRYKAELILTDFFSLTLNPNLSEIPGFKDKKSTANQFQVDSSNIQGDFARSIANKERQRNQEGTTRLPFLEHCSIIS